MRKKKQKLNVYISTAITSASDGKFKPVCSNMTLAGEVLRIMYHTNLLRSSEPN
jgi:hypothetical protein